MKKIQSEEILEMENKTETTDAITSNRIQELERESQTLKIQEKKQIDQ